MPQYVKEAKSPGQPVWKRLLAFWLVTRLWLTFWVLLCSKLKPFTPIENQVPVWPPVSPVGSWLERILLAPWDRWDVSYFRRIATVGYVNGEGTLAFQPLYPWLSGWIGFFLGGNDLLGLTLFANACGFFSLLLLYHLARLDLPEADAYRATIFYLGLPVAFILFAPYTESLFLLLSVSSFLFARKRKWVLAGVAAGLASLTRQQGLFLFIPLAWESWESAGKQWRAFFSDWRSLASIMICPAAYLAWIVYRAIAVNDVIFDPAHPQNFFYGLLLSPNAQKVVPGQTFLPPWQAMWVALNNLDSVTVIDLSTGLIYLLLFLLCARRLWQIRPSYFLYTLILFLVSFSYSTGAPHAYQGLPRHCLLAFPLAVGLAQMLRRKMAFFFFLALGQILMMALSFFYVCRIFWLP